MGVGLQDGCARRSGHDGIVLAVAPVVGARAQGTATSGWSTEASKEQHPSIGTGQSPDTGNPTLCASFQKGVMQRIGIMRTLRFGPAKAPPLAAIDGGRLEEDVKDGSDAAKKYADEEAMVSASTAT